MKQLIQILSKFFGFCTHNWKPYWFPEPNGTSGCIAICKICNLHCLIKSEKEFIKFFGGFGDWK